MDAATRHQAMSAAKLNFEQEGEKDYGVKRLPLTYPTDLNCDPSGAGDASYT